MKSIEERLTEMREDPAKFKRVFTAVWLIAYSMMILGFVLILWVMLTG